MRPLQELVDVVDPAWPAMKAAFEAARSEVLATDRPRAEATILALQVTARSALGALALHTGGVLVDHGWLKLLGGGEGILNLAALHGSDLEAGRSPGQLLVALDVLGGTYAINGGDLVGALGDVCYFAPDELRWMSLEMGHSVFVAWVLSDAFADFNAQLRWPRWERETERLAADEGLSVYPFPFTEQGRDLARVSRKPVPMTELVGLWEDLAAQVQGLPDGGRFNLEIDDR